MKIKYNATVTYKTVDTIIKETSNGGINLNAAYQREVIWDPKKMGGFINSVLKGIVPNNLIFSTQKVGDDMEIVCVDGKQRMTSLIMFKNNEISTKLDGDKNLYWFDEIPEEYDGDEGCKVLSKPDRFTFLNRNIPLVQYNNLDYVDQIDIFRRIVYE